MREVDVSGAVAGLRSPSEGALEVHGEPSEEGRLRGCAYMPQSDLLLPWLSAVDNAALALRNRGLRRAAAREAAEPLLREFGLEGFEASRPSELSGGMRQRVAFARTVLAGKPGCSGIEIARPRADVASYAADPGNVHRLVREHRRGRVADGAAACDRIANRVRGEVPGPRPVYTYEIRELAPGERLVMSTSEGPFPMETTYTWRDAGPGATRMSLRNRGEPSGFTRVAAPMMAAAMRRANEKDLRRLKDQLEAQPAPRGRPVRGGL